MKSSDADTSIEGAATAIGGIKANAQPIKMGIKATKVRNKAPAPIQITAEQLLREAKERELEVLPPPPKSNIQDEEEKASYQGARRREFEDNIRKNRSVVSNWIKYAKWEEGQAEMPRARSVFERALDADHRNVVIWLQYAEMEMRNRQVNHARNIWDRAVTILPRANQFWLKYSYMEEMVGNVPGARQVFERWMEWEPPEQAWQTYINFEIRYKEIDRARQLWQRFLHVHPEANNWLRYAKFEMRQGAIHNARQVYERAIEYFGEDNLQEKLLVAFAKFEEQQKEYERARVVYRFALDYLPKEAHEEVFKAFTQFEKRHGERRGIETAIVSKRRAQYEQQVTENNYDYDAWFDYIKLMQSESDDYEEVRDIFERAIAAVPPKQEKRLWRRYIYLWINYAIFEELDTKDLERCREVYKACLDIIPHKSFTFAKIWIMFSHFELRQLNLKEARKILGVSIGKCPKEKLFRSYIDMELQLREFDRCRTLYEKCLEWQPENCLTWMKFAELETLLGDTDRARAIYELAIQQPALDMPEVLWKSYIDFEIGQEENENARNLYRRLLQRTRHVKVWLSYAQFELQTQEDISLAHARQVLKKGNDILQQAQASNEERLKLLEFWMNMEKERGDDASIKNVEKEMPRRVKKRRPIITADGSEAGWQEYYDYIWPTDQANAASLKLLELAKKWKKTKTDDEPEANASKADNHEDETKPEQHQDELANSTIQNPDADSDISSTSSEESDDEIDDKK